MIKIALITLLSGNTTAGTNIHIETYPSGLRPAVVLKTVSTPHEYSSDGDLNCFNSAIEIDVFADDYNSAATIAGEINTIISGYRGTVGDYRIDAVFIESQSDLSSNVAAGEEVSISRINISAQVHWS